MLRKNLLVLSLLLLPATVFAAEEVPADPDPVSTTATAASSESASDADMTAGNTAESASSSVSESVASEKAAAPKEEVTVDESQPTDSKSTSVAELKSDTPAVKPSLAQSETPVANFKQPDLLSFSVGYVDFDKDEKRTQSAGFRLEYRWGYSLLSAQNDWMNFGLRPLAGIDVSTRAQKYAFGGLAFDFVFWDHFVFTESEAVGFFDSGNAKPLGSFIEFRSQAELGYRFDNNVRITGEISHISNAGLTHRNPGEEIAGAYIHIPVCSIFGR